MSAAALLTELEAAGVRLASRDSGSLTVDAPRGVVTAELKEALRRHKTEIISLLQATGGEETCHAYYIELLYVYEERAAIMEFDGGLSRDEASRLAAREVFDTPEKLRAFAEGHPAVRSLLQSGCEIVDVRFSERRGESVG